MEPAAVVPAGRSGPSTGMDSTTVAAPGPDISVTTTAASRRSRPDPSPPSMAPSTGWAAAKTGQN